LSLTVLLLGSPELRAEPNVTGVADCVQAQLEENLAPPAPQLSSYNEVLSQMERNPYNLGNLPLIPITLFRAIAKRLIPDFYVARRSQEILNEGQEFRKVGMPKPIHPMGVGFEGVLEMNPSSKWSGAFAGGKFPVLARASISQGNPLKIQVQSWLRRLFDRPAKVQPRSTALAIKVYFNPDKGLAQKPANVVFQNDLNGAVGADGHAINWTSAEMTNQPGFNALKIRHFYEVMTLLGVARGSLRTATDRLAKFPYINPLLRPVHSLSELGVKSAADVHPPVWVMVRPSKDMETVVSDDFRQEIYQTAQKNGAITYDFYAADQLDARGQKVWERVGTLRLERPILSQGVDQNLLMPHDTLKSTVTGNALQMPVADPNNLTIYDDVQ
jgi:hypothetical protein